MTSFGRLVAFFWRWIDSTAAALVGGIARFTTAKAMRVIEEPDGSLLCNGIKLPVLEGRIADPIPQNAQSALRQSRIDLVLQPNRFVFRPLELPQRATEFLGGIVSAQIDRLTPWSAGEVAFGWTSPKNLDDDRVVVTVAATARSLFAPLLAGLAAQGPKTIRVLTPAPADEGAELVEVYDHAPGHAADLRRLRYALAGIVLLAALAATGSFASLLWIGEDLDTQRFATNRRIAELRANALMGRESPTGVAALERRKRETPSGVIVIDSLSRVLPDHSYLTEFRIQGDKMQIVGMTRDAPSLIRLIEQSPHFTRATFFAPTTRSAGETAEHFSIEARIAPGFAVGP